MTPPLTGRATGGFNCGELPDAFSPDGTQLVFQNFADQFDNTSGNNLYLYRSSGSVSSLVSVTSGPNVFFGGASADLGHVVFETSAQLTAAAQPLSGADVNLYDVSGGQVHLIDVDNSGVQLGPDGAELGNSPTHPNSGSVQNAVSSDRSKVFFEVPNDPVLGGHVGLYMREDNATTTLISQPAAGVSSTPEDATFEGASADGSKVFFWTNQQLTADDTNGDADLYEYNTVTGQLTRVTAGAVPDPGLLGVMAISSDGSHVYFVASSQLIAGQGTAGQNNLYDYNTDTKHADVVTTLSPNDAMPLYEPNTDSGAFVAGSLRPDEQALPAAQATPDGMHLVFLSQANLTSYDAHGNLEVYEYSAASSSITCVSCNPSGAPPSGVSTPGVTGQPAPGASLLSPNAGDNAEPYFGGPPAANSAYRNVSDDGSRVVFQSPDALTPGAPNDVVYGAYSDEPLYAQNVYEWEQGGTGSCPAASVKGCISLISGGNSSSGGWFANMSPSGNDIYFYTRSSLASSDTDGGVMDIYDARVDGGFAASVTPTVCSGQECHPGSSPPSLVTFTGPGNVSGNVSGSAAGASFHVLAVTAAQRGRLPAPAG